MDKLSTENKFAVMPEWVIELAISHTAFRLYAVLARYADNVTHQAFPSLETLAGRLGCGEKTVRRAIEDLVAHGAIKKHARGRYQSSLYTIMTTPPKGSKVSGEGSDMSGEGSKMSHEGSNLSTRSVKNVQVTRTTELEPQEREPQNYIDTKTSLNRNHRLPENWYPSERLLEMFAHKWPDVDRDFEIDQFINYWHAEGKTKADWDRAFQVWMNRAEKQSKPRQQARKLTNAEQGAILTLQLRQKREQREALEAIEAKKRLELGL
jgi:biotin operon repressor